MVSPPRATGLYNTPRRTSLSYKFAMIVESDSLSLL